MIQGKNGLGKSSLINVIKYAFGRRADGSRSIEHDPRLLHGAADKGDATIAFDDDTQLRVLVTRDSTTRMTKPKDGKRWAKATTEIDAIANALSYDPIQFKGMNEKQRVETLLRVMPIKVTAKEIADACAGMSVSLNGLPPSLEAINGLYQNIYEARRDENVAADTQSKHADELERALPPESESGDYQAEITNLRSELLKVERQVSEFRERATHDFTEYTDQITRARDEQIAELRAIFDENVAKLRSESQQLIDAKRAETQKSVDEVKAAAQPEQLRLNAAISVAQERLEHQHRTEGTRKAAETARAEATRRKATSASMTEALGRLTALKQAVAARLPIKNITIASPRDNMPVDICREEKGALVPFSLWNEASKILFCLKIAMLTPGQCGIICVDSIDGIDPETRPAFEDTCKKYAEKEGLQFLLGEATGGELRIKELEG